MNLELDGNINNKDSIKEISEKRLNEIKQEFQIICKFIQSMIIKK